MSRKAGKIALGLGLLTGAITGLLFAPEEGKKVRQKIAKGDTQGLLKDLAHVGEELKVMVMDIAKNPSVVEAMDKAKDRAAEVANMKREELDAMLKKANKKADDFKKTVEKYVKEQKSMIDEKIGGKKKSATKKSMKKPAVKKSTKKSSKKKS
ncbi:MAG: YtxH domain-containing protein [Patescibacteria group bacterium]